MRRREKNHNSVGSLVKSLLCCLCRKKTDRNRNNEIDRKDSAVSENPIHQNRRSSLQLTPTKSRRRSSVGKFESLKELIASADGLANENRRDEAFVKYGIAFKDCKTLYGETSANVAVVARKIANNFRASGSHDLAIGYLQTALDVKTALLGANHSDVGDLYFIIGDSLDEEKKYQDSITTFEKAMMIYSLSIPDSMKLGNTLFNLGLISNKVNSTTQAKEYYQKALVVTEKALGADHAETSLTLKNLGDTCSRLGEWDKAHKLMERAFKIVEKKVGTTHPKALAIQRLIDKTTKNKIWHTNKALQSRYDTCPPCHAGHAATLDLPEVGTACEVCRKPLGELEDTDKVWRCVSCDFDLCTKCDVTFCKPLRKK